MTESRLEKSDMSLPDSLGRMHVQRSACTMTCLAAVCGLFLTCAIARAQDSSACTSRDWFIVQQARLDGSRLSPICAGELEAAENRRGTAGTRLQAVIAANPHSAAAYAAHSALTNLYLRNGRFREANAQLLAMSAIRPGAPEVQNVSPLFKLLATHPDLVVVSRHTTTVLTHVIDGNVFAPLTVNGAARAYMLDTGMNLSMMSESEAKSLGVNPQSSTTAMTDISGLSGPAARVVEIDHLLIGGTVLHHVPFLVVDDSNGAFVGIPAGQRGILGIQPLLALQTMSFKRDGTLSIGDAAESTPTTAPLLFDGAFPLTRIACQGRPLTVTFDMGATQTTLNPPFAKLFPEVLRGASSEAHKLNGVSGSTYQRSVSFAHLQLSFGREVELSPATVLLDETTATSAYAAANIGYDVMQQARPFTIDFARMLVSFPLAP